MYEGACMRAQHKMLPDGTGARYGWIMTKQMEKLRFVLEKQAARKAQHQTGQKKWQPQQQPLQQTHNPHRQQQWQPQHQRQQQWQPHQQLQQWQNQQ